MIVRALADHGDVVKAPVRHPGGAVPSISDEILQQSGGRAIWSGRAGPAMPPKAMHAPNRPAGSGPGDVRPRAPPTW